MSLAKLDRRQMLMGIGAGAVGTSALAALAPATALAGDEDPSGLLGGWDITITTTSPPSPAREAALMFAAGGGFVIVDSTTPATTGVGGWTKEGNNGFRFKFLAFDATGARIVVQASGTAHQGTISGPFRFVVGNNVFSGSGTFSGTKGVEE